MLRYWKEFTYNSLFLFCTIFAPRDALCDGNEEAMPTLIPEYTIDDDYKPATYCPTHILCDKYFEENKNIIGDIYVCENKNIQLRRYKQIEKDIIVKTYNNFRNYIAGGKSLRKFPTAADMIQLEWDDDLEEEARRLLGICADMFVDQNITAFGRSKDVYVADVYNNHMRSEVEESRFVNNTFRELLRAYRLFDLSMISNYTFHELYYKFTTAAFAKSRYIGCARTQPYWRDFISEPGYAPAEACFLMPSEERLYSQPSANILYQEGKPCSLCPFGFKCYMEYPNLCR